VKDTSQEVSKGQRHEPSLPTPPSAKDTPNISLSGIERSRDFHTTLTISTTEAALGVNRTITLPDRQRVKVAVPAGAYNGQVIRLERQIEATAPNTPKGDVIVTLAVTPKAESAVVEAIPGLPSIHWRTYLLFGLALIILLSGIIGLSQFGVSLLPSNRTNAINNKTGTGLHTLQATSSAATASAVAQATATAQANATAAVTANLYNSGLKTLALNESLSKNSTTSRWDETSGGCAFTTGGYQVTATHVCVARSTDFRDFAFEVQMKILKGDGGGILLRSTSSASYYFRISQNGNYALLACAAEGASCNRILTSSFSSAINSGQNQSNLIAVAATGNLIELYVNNERIDHVNDNSSLHGQIGVIAEPASEVVFSNARVWTP
jgi:hypothetical protein